MSSRLLWGLATAAILLQMCIVSWARVTVAVHFITYGNTRGKDHEDKPCDPPFGVCDHYFEICIDEIADDYYQHLRHPPDKVDWVSNCDWRWRTKEYKNENENTFGEDMRTVANPIYVDIGDSAKGVAVRVRVMDHDTGIGGPPDIVDYLTFNYIIRDDNGLSRTQGSATPFKKLLTGTRSFHATSLHMDFSAFCAKNYYMYRGQCTRFCKEDLTHHLGEVICTEDGLRCYKGGKGDPTNCTTDDQTNVIAALAPQQSTQTANNNTGLIVGVIVGTLVFIIIIVIVVALLLRERRKRKLKEAGTSTAVSTSTMGQQTLPGTTDMGTGGSYANPAFLAASSNTAMQTDNIRNQRTATQTANGRHNGVKAMEAGLLSPPPYKVADIPTGGSERFNNMTYGEEQFGAGGGGDGTAENVYDDVGLSKKY